MAINEKPQPEQNWKNISVTPNDIQNLNNAFFENEEPLSTEELSRLLVTSRLKEQRNSIAAKLKQLGTPYYPKTIYKEGESIVFPMQNWAVAKVLSIREGNNPLLPPFQVASVEFEDGSQKQYAIGLEKHALNGKDFTKTGDITTETDEIIKKYGRDIKASLLKQLREQSEFVRIGYTWFPQSLLIDMNKGQINLAEALLDAQKGKPLSTAELIEQMELKSKDNPKLLEFSLNYALQEDPRFDEVGTSGEFCWYLRKYEPNTVLEKPIFLQNNAPAINMVEQADEIEKLFKELDDELAYGEIDYEELDAQESSSIVLNYPHWQAGSLPILPSSFGIIPSALETEHVFVQFIDAKDQKITAWVNVKDKYVIGLKDWYDSEDLMPGSIIELTRTDQPGAVLIRPQKKHTNKEWIKTLLVGSDNGLVMMLQRQPISAGFNERLAIKILNPDALAAIWNERAKHTIPLDKDMMRMMNELAKLNNQSHVHFTELYAAVNLTRRCSPQELLAALQASDGVKHIGDNYYHLVE